MNQKDYKKVKVKEVRELFQKLNASKKTIARVLNVGESSLRRWVRNKAFPIETWVTLNSPEFAELLSRDSAFTSINKEFRRGAYSTELPEELKIAVEKSKAKGCIKEEPSFTADSGGSESLSVDLSSIAVERLVDEIESRGWKVSLSRKQDE